MAYLMDRLYKVSAADATTATLVPQEADAGKAHVPSTQVVLTFAATPAEFVAGVYVQVRVASC